MKIATMQFKTSISIEHNFSKINTLMSKAINEDTDILLTQECALCGYPPVEIPDINKIDFEYLSKMEDKLFEIANQNNITLLLGTITKNEGQYFNSIKFNLNNNINSYNKRALWGWDLENFKPGSESGVINKKNVTMGVRICYEVRFPEYFRELFAKNTKICFVSFCDVSEKEDNNRFNMILGHLQTRAVENCMYIVSSNSTNKYQTAPTCIIDQNGKIIKIASTNTEDIIYFDYHEKEISFGEKGRLLHSKELLKKYARH